VEISRILTMLAVACVLLLLPANCQAYSPFLDNSGAHPWINEAAVEWFEENTMRTDPCLSMCSINGIKCMGDAWPGYRTRVYQVPQLKEEKTLKEWIMHGGFSADEPEAAMALRHFYDPTNPQEPWLTDQTWLASFVGYINRVGGVPMISARDWAFEGPGYQSSPKRNIIRQDYSFPDAKAYFEEALLSDNRYNAEYGKAWRAVGETMHLVSDMTCPAHVRNDGHAYSDPYEDSVMKADIYRYATYSPSPSINYEQEDMSQLMHDLAAWTNKHFFSADTLPGEQDFWGRNITANGCVEYPLPKVGNGADSDGYLYNNVDGRGVKAAKVSYWKTKGIVNTTMYALDKQILEEQKAVLIPTAVRASASVLDVFLPRFTVSIDVFSPGTGAADTYTMNGRLNHIKTAEWPDAPNVRNGASIVVADASGSVRYRSYVICSHEGYLNEFTEDFRALPGDSVFLEYDFGGYVIRSQKYRIPGEQSAQVPSYKPGTGVTPTPWPGVWVPGQDFDWNTGQGSATLLPYP
jgi:hypothetical protein